MSLKFPIVSDDVNCTLYIFPTVIPNLCNTMLFTNLSYLMRNSENHVLCRRDIITAN